MSATLSPPRDDDAVATGLSTPARPEIRAATGATLLPVAVARAIAFVALATWGALHWMSMLEPAEPGRAWTVIGVGVLAVVAMLGAGRLEGRRRYVAAAAAIVPLAALMLMAGRIADELLMPGGWSELAGGISRGISDLPGVRVPYRGLDDWVRTVIPLGGSVLVLLAALLAFWPRRSKLGFPVAALLVLMVLYVVPVVALDFTVEFFRGAVFTLLMVAFLRLEKLRRPDSPAAAALAVVATLVALVAAPILNRDTPWFDYETWAAETSTSKSTSFTWDVQNYGGLNWPRDGRELIRVKARTPAYWKAQNLDAYDGHVWTRSQVPVRRPRAAGRQRSRDQALDAADQGLDPQPALGPVHHRGLRIEGRHPPRADDPDVGRAVRARRARCAAATRTRPRSTRPSRRRPSAGARASTTRPAWRSTRRSTPTCRAPPAACG